MSSYFELSHPPVPRTRTLGKIPTPEPWLGYVPGVAHGEGGRGGGDRVDGNSKNNNNNNNNNNNIYIVPIQQ